MPRIFAGTGTRQLRAGESRQDPARSRPDPRAAACGEHGEDGEDGACAWVLLRGQRPLFAGRQPFRLGASAPKILSADQSRAKAQPPRRVALDGCRAIRSRLCRLRRGPILGPDDQASRFGTKGRRRRPAGENDGGRVTGSAGAFAARLCRLPRALSAGGRGGSASLVPVCN